ncbi:MAG TPA: tRNA (guanosine(37)-N1)-methyltransferase TrmD [Pelolinea sp.]|nr:tRNA (guanosine(37)-N1)-methyltransferase TrmD [Pelolinea sp.]
MIFDVFTIFPEVFDPYVHLSILGKAVESKIIQINIFNLRDWTKDKHHTTDDTPFGGGGGMVMKPEPIFSAVEDIEGKPPRCPVILMSPQGELLSHQKAMGLSGNNHLSIICGRYEGVDERVREHLVTDEISIGDFVLSGGELPALVLIEVITRLLPGALGDPNGAQDDSFASGLLEYPHYTRPAEFRDWITPDVLLSGNHKEIHRWRRKQALMHTIQKRSDLLTNAVFNKVDIELIREISKEMDVHPSIINLIRGENEI